MFGLTCDTSLLRHVSSFDLSLRACVRDCACASGFGLGSPTKVGKYKQPAQQPETRQLYYHACMVSANPLPHSADCMLVSVLPQLLVGCVCWAVAFETHRVSVACVLFLVFPSKIVWGSCF